MTALLERTRHLASEQRPLPVGRTSSNLKAKAPAGMNTRDANARMDTHEAVCAERYAGINARLKRVEGWVISMVVATMGLMATIIVKGFH